jgi:hypothetical protein
VTLLMVTVAHPQIVAHRTPTLGRLVQPRHYSSIEETARAGVPWAADNDCYQHLDPVAYERMIDRLAGVPGCRFVVCPDVVGEHGLTDLYFEEWAPQLHMRGLPVAYVLQEDGVEYESRPLPWGAIDALFIGGAATEFKLGPSARDLVAEAKRRGKWVHMGRVNTRRRYDYARAIGCDSVDGTKFARWRRTYLDDALRWSEQEILAVAA